MTKAEFGLSLEELQEWGERVSVFRAKLTKKRSELNPPEPKYVPADQGIRSRKGIPPSIGERGPEDNTLAEEKQRWRLENKSHSRLKKRRFSEVSVDECQQIVDEVHKGLRSHKDIANEFLVSVHAVISLLK